MTPTRTSEPAPTTPPIIATFSHGSSNWQQSPDGKWFYWVDEEGVQEKRPNGRTNHFMHTSFANESGDFVWRLRVPSEDIPADFFGSQFYYIPVFWLPSEPYVYITTWVSGIDGGVGPINGWNLSRLDLRTGTVSRVISGWREHYFSFSPGGDYLIDALSGTPKINIFNLTNGRKIEIQLSSSMVPFGGGAFSPDRKQFVILSCEPKPEQGWCDVYQLLLVNLEKSAYTVISRDLYETIGLDKIISLKYEWVSATTVSIETDQNGSQPDNRWLLDLNTGQVNEIR